MQSYASTLQHQLDDGVPHICLHASTRHQCPLASACSVGDIGISPSSAPSCLDIAIRVPMESQTGVRYPVLVGTGDISPPIV
jgi:hypothetical protein